MKGFPFALRLQRVMVKRVLRKYGYPPDKQEKATQTVLQQAKLLCPDWAMYADWAMYGPLLFFSIRSVFHSGPRFRLSVRS
jgi:hypothetical protein